ncbi:MAG TPA: hypothetical protein VK191_08480 [Symbiobacteriaceae bacterium]|nr:hypothetical protein [Symbiobacteriaceae bacterium]
MSRDQGGLLVVSGILGALPLVAHLLLVGIVGLRAFLLADGTFQLLWAGVGLVAAIFLVRAAQGTRLPLAIAALLWGGGAVVAHLGAPPLLPLLGAQLLLIGWGLVGITRRP